MIAYVDSSMLTRAYLVDELGHAAAVATLADPECVAVTGTWTRVEVSGAIVRAARHRRSIDADHLLHALDIDLGGDGAITVLTAPQDEIERSALELARAHGLRAMDAWHLAVAALVVPPLALGDPMGFASRDADQAQIAESFGFLTL